MTERAEIRRPHGRLSVALSGQAGGRTILLSNSLGAGPGMWAPQRAMLEASYRVIGYDTRGHGLSDTPGGDYSFDDLTGDAIAILDHFEVETTDFLGLSLGGMTGLGLGLDHAARFGKIVCACARADNPPPFVASWDTRIAAIAEGGLAAIWPGTRERWLTEDCVAAEPAIVAALEADFAKTTPEGYRGCAKALQQLDYLRRLGDMTRPVLYIAGAQDTGAPPEAMRAMHAATPGSAYVEIDDCAHIANLNRPAAFNAALRRFLDP